MSHFSVRGEQSTSSEITALTNLAALATSAAGEFIRKTGATTFENATPSAGSFATTALDNLASVAINAALVLGTSDAFALGSATKMWSDLFLASGAVINFNAGAATLTHGANLLTLGGSGAVTLALGTNSITMTGSIAATGARVTKGWFTDIESTNAPTVSGSAVYYVGGTDVAVTDGGTGLSAITALSIWVANSANTITEVTPGAGKSIRINAGGTAWEAFTPSATTPTAITVADEAADTTSFIAFFTAATGDLGPKTNANMTFNASTGVVTFASAVLTTADINGGTLDGVIIGGASAAAATVTTLGAGAITSTGLLTVTVAGTVARLVNSTDGASVQVLKLEGDRATMADADEAYVSYILSNDGGTQSEFARLTWIADDVNAGTSIDGSLKWSIAIAGSLTAKAILQGSVFSPAASDGTALGSTSLYWSDLFLASGGVINFNADMTITHAADTLTFAGGTVVLGVATATTYNGMTISTSTGTFTLTNAKTFAVTNSITLSGTDSTTMTFPASSATLAGLAIAQSFTALQTFTLAGVPVRMLNTTDNASVQVLKLEGDRATMADADEAYASLILSDDGGTQVEFGRITWVATDVNVGTSLDGAIDFSVITAGSLAKEMRLTGAALSPSTTDGLALGTSSLAWADADFADGAVIRFNNSYTITHSTGALTLSGTLSIGTSNAFTAGTIELGHATANTLSASGGVLSIEGVAVLTVAGGTLTGNITLGENTSIALDPAGSADGKYSGITVTGTGGATIAFGDLVTLDKDDSRWELVDISVAAAATGDARGIIGIAVTSSTDGGAITVLLQGIVRADANFPALTIGAAVFASTTGDIVVTQPTTTDHVIRQVGFALTADEIFFSPTQTWVTHT